MLIKKTDNFDWIAVFKTFNMLIWFPGNPRMGWRSYEIVCRAASKTDNPSGKCRDIMGAKIIILCSVLQSRKQYIIYSYPNFRRWDTARKEYLDASHQTLYLYLTLSFWRLTKKTKPNNSRTIKPVQFLSTSYVIEIMFLLTVKRKSNWCMFYWYAFFVFFSIAIFPSSCIDKIGKC